MTVNAASVAAVAQGLEDTDETTLIIGDPDPDPVAARGASDSAAAPTSTTPAATGVGQDESEVAEDDDESVDQDPAVVEDDDAEFDDDELVALEELQAYYREQAAREFEQSVVPKLQSTYDRQIAALNKQVQESREAATAREKLLLDQVREAQMNGLGEAEKAKLREQWDYDDRLRELDSREQELTGYHTELLREAYAQEYAEFGVTAEDLVEFSNPEDMESFVRDVELEYYRQLAEFRSKGGLPDEDDDDESPTSARNPKPAAKKAPAGASAPTDAGAGSAVPSVTKFNSGQSAGAMAENIRNGWETVQIR